jgi:hypothetical protein
MASFLRPPTHQEPFAAPGQDQLWSRVFFPRGNTVLRVGATVTPVYTPETPGLAEVTQAQIETTEAAGGRAYLGGHIYELTSQEVTDLTAAGYGSFISTTPP